MPRTPNLHKQIISYNSSAAITTALSLSLFTSIAGLLSKDLTFFAVGLVAPVTIFIGFSLGKAASHSLLITLPLSVYTLITLLSYLLNIYFTGQPNTYSDEAFFFRISYLLSGENRPGVPAWALTRDAVEGETYSWAGYHWLLSHIGLILEVIHSNSFLTLKYITAISSSFVTLFTFLIARTILGLERDAKKAALILSVFPCFLFFSNILLRDILIVLIYTATFYVILCNKTGPRTLSAVFLLCVVAYLFRPSNGIFLTLIAAGLVLFEISNARTLKPNTKLAARTISVFVFIGTIFWLNDAIFSSIETVNRYIERGINSGGSGSYGALLYRLPFPVDMFTRSLFSQLLPFPFWRGLAEQPIRAVLMFNGFFWVPTISLGIFGLINKKTRRSLPTPFILLVIGCIGYILVVSYGGNDIRRLMPVYPIIFLIAYHTAKKTYASNTRGIIFTSVSLLSLLHIIYLFLGL